MWLLLWACAPFSPGEDGRAELEAAPLQQQAVCPEAGASCDHTFGGEYGDGACSAGYQCCDGSWGARGACGACACVEPSGQTGCASEPAQAGCVHTFGGIYGDGACSAGYQCCDGAWGARDRCGTCTCTEPTGSDGCGADTCFEPFVGAAAPLSAERRTAMTGVTWTPDCPVPLDDLVEITAGHWDFDEQPATGRIVVHADVADVVLDALRVAWETGYPIQRMEPVEAFGGDDDASMAANNTSAFNCRRVTSGSSWSQHSYGDAVDLNPRQNPYVRGSTVLPPEGGGFLDRDPSDPGVLVASSPVTQAFVQHGWVWGGTWSSLKDYQHFSANGR